MTENILQHLRVKRSPPTLEYVQELITAYCSNVPWESVSKIIRKDLCGRTTDCLRLENEFWRSAFQNGTGGTCYESNWAFFCLLRNLGFEGYLTINRIIDKSSVHSAIVIVISVENTLSISAILPMHLYPLLKKGLQFQIQPRFIIAAHLLPQKNIE